MNMEFGERQESSRARPWLISAIATLAWGMFTILILHIVSSHNPILDTLSSYAFTDRGEGLLAASILSMAISSLALLGALIATGVPISRTSGILFGTWSIGLMLAAVFPASFKENVNPVSGEIHQYACVVAFISVPALGFSMLERLRGLPETAGSTQKTRKTLSRLTLFSVGTLGLFGLSYILAAFPENETFSQLSALLPVGLTQRIALVADLVFFGWLMLLAARAARSAQTTEPMYVADQPRLVPLGGANPGFGGEQMLHNSVDEHEGELAASVVGGGIHSIPGVGGVGGARGIPR